MSGGYGKSGVGFGLTRDQSIEMIVRTCIDNGITDHRQIAYVLATAQHESRDFAAPEEDWGRKQAVDLRYFGGEEYYGRGFAHLTHVNNYERLGEALGMGRELAEHPERAAEAEIATKVLVVGMRDGMFGTRLSNNINANHVDYRQARASVNGGELNNGSPYPDSIATLATGWESQVAGLVQRVQQPDFQMPVPTNQAPAAAMDLQRGDASQHVLEAQQYLQRLGMRNNANAEIRPDGDFGSSTEQAVRRFQTERGISPANGHIDEALLQRLRSDTLTLDPDFKRRTVTDLTGPLADGNLQPGERGEPVFEMRRQLEALGYLAEPNPARSAPRAALMQTCRPRCASSSLIRACRCARAASLMKMRDASLTMLPWRGNMPPPPNSTASRTGRHSARPIPVPNSSRTRCRHGSRRQPILQRLHPEPWNEYLHSSAVPSSRFRRTMPRCSSASAGAHQALLAMSTSCRRYWNPSATASRMPSVWIG
jgi:Putative peptidoglycan-binding domain-containing protein